MTALLWLRRDLRRADHPALVAAAEHGPVHPVFVLDPRLWDSAGLIRRGWLAATLLALRDSFEGHLTMRVGDPVWVLGELADQTRADSVHLSTETTPYGQVRDARVRAALGIDWVETGSPYAVTPGRIRKPDGSPYAVFTPWARAWREHGWRAPAVEPAGLRLAGDGIPDDLEELLHTAVRECPVELPEAGETGALRRWESFREHALPRYADRRNRPDLDATSALSPYLKYGVLHPRTLLADLHGPGSERFATELAWREFYADVLFHQPDSAWTDLRPLGIGYDESAEDFAAWAEGRTGYPIVDAGMRQLAGTGWMHNRVRMIVASFLTKDLHQWWPAGARYFLDHLLDGDLASNSHGWQWTAGTGTDAAPYFRVFNPVLQGERFDPRGDYVRRWVPELAHLPGKKAHTPWDQPDGYAHGYPERIVDHHEERREALARLGATKENR